MNNAEPMMIWKIVLSILQGTMGIRARHKDTMHFTCNIIPFGNKSGVSPEFACGPRNEMLRSSQLVNTIGPGTGNLNIIHY